MMHPIGILLHITTLLFVALKLTGHIDWSWWWVLLPSYGTLALGLLLLLIARIIFLFLPPQEQARIRAAEALKELAEQIERRKQ